jgi:hypothetical protein
MITQDDAGTRCVCSHLRKMFCWDMFSTNAERSILLLFSPCLQRLLLSVLALIAKS